MGLTRRILESIAEKEFTPRADVVEPDRPTPPEAPAGWGKPTSFDYVPVGDGRVYVRMQWPNGVSFTALEQPHTFGHTKGQPELNVWLPLSHVSPSGLALLGKYLRGWGKWSGGLYLYGAPKDMNIVSALVQDKVFTGHENIAEHQKGPGGTYDEEVIDFFASGGHWNAMSAGDALKQADGGHSGDTGALPADIRKDVIAEWWLAIAEADDPVTGDNPVYVFNPVEGVGTEDEETVVKAVAEVGANTGWRPLDSIPAGLTGDVGPHQSGAWVLWPEVGPNASDFFEELRKMIDKIGSILPEDL